MTDDELDAAEDEARLLYEHDGDQRQAAIAILALVAEVRRLRAEVERGRLRAVRDESVVALRALNSAVWLDHPSWAITRAETARASEVIARHERETGPAGTAESIAT